MWENVICENGSSTINFNYFCLKWRGFWSNLIMPHVTIQNNLRFGDICLEMCGQKGGQHSPWGQLESLDIFVNTFFHHFLHRFPWYWPLFVNFLNLFGKKQEFVPQVLKQVGNLSCMPLKYIFFVFYRENLKYRVWNFLNRKKGILCLCKCMWEREIVKEKDRESEKCVWHNR